MLALIPTSVVHAQLSAVRGPVALTLEGYANVTDAFAVQHARSTFVEDGEPRLDAALRGLLRWSNSSGPDVGVRAVLETSPENKLDLAEASLLIFGRGGRLEIGERQGLPDVLLGYAPNNFTFTGAEFGPASGASLDPGGGLQAAFLQGALGSRLRELSVLGFAASLSDDRSTKILYVSPKARGWLSGVSYSADASDPRFRDLVQAGLTHDTYWGENVLHVGGSYSLARAAVSHDAPRRDLQSLNLGATLILNYDWMLGASVTYDGTTGLARSNVVGALPSDGWGAVVSLNYNRGPWTAGAFVQRSSREREIERGGGDVLTAFEAGLSYRVSTKVRLYGAWYAFDLNEAGGARAADRHNGRILLVGVRATL